MKAPWLCLLNPQKTLDAERMAACNTGEGGARLSLSQSVNKNKVAKSQLAEGRYGEWVARRPLNLNAGQKVSLGVKLWVDTEGKTL